MTIKQQGGIFGRNPTYNDVTVDGSISVDTISEKTSGSGVTIDGFQAIAGGAVASANSPKIELSSANANGYNYRFQSNNSGYFTLTQADGSVLTGDGTVLRYNPSGYFDIYQNLAFADGKGIDFSATSGTGTSELFSDYEEGSWSPVVNAYSGTPTTSGYYTKIGQQVTLEGSVQLDGTSDASVVRFSSLPFTVASPYLGGAYLTYNSGGVADVIVNIDSSSRLELRNSSGTQLSFNTIGVSALLTFVVSYRAA